MAKILTTLQQIKRQKEWYEERLYADSLALIEHKARKILASHPSLDEFVMAMGGWLFTLKGKDDHISTAYREYIPAYMKGFMQMMDDFDDMELKVTGEPIRFTSTGPIVRTWGICDGMDGTAVAERYASPSDQLCVAESEGTI